MTDFKIFQRGDPVPEYIITQEKKKPWSIPGKIVFENYTVYWESKDGIKNIKAVFRSKGSNRAAIIVTRAININLNCMGTCMHKGFMFRNSYICESDISAEISKIESERGVTWDVRNY